jgi:hypothetical protein
VTPYGSPGAWRRTHSLELSAYTVAVKGGESQPVLADFLRHGVRFSASLHPDGRIGDGSAPGRQMGFVHRESG